MRIAVAFMCVAFSCLACTTKDILDLPEASHLPAHWGQMSEARFSGSDCPLISGAYSEPPDVFQIDKKGQREFQGIEASYYGLIPFHIADGIEDNSNELGLYANELRIQQTSPTHFSVAYITARRTSVEHVFNALEGDFECIDGYIQFPIYSSHGMIEGMSVNFQIRNVMYKDLKGSLMIQTTTGPYRKYIMNSKNIFNEEFYRYQLIGKRK